MSIQAKAIPKIKARQLHDIIVDILTVLSAGGATGVPISRIVHRARIAHRSLKKYIEDLISRGFITILAATKKRAQHKRFVVITDKGLAFLQAFGDMNLQMRLMLGHLSISS